MYTFEIDASAPKADLYAELARAADALTSGAEGAIASHRYQRAQFDDHVD